jgi:hypothetical protein
MAISNNYALQPVLPTVARALGVSQEATGLIAGSLQVGYMADCPRKQAEALSMGSDLDERAQSLSPEGVVSAICS